MASSLTTSRAQKKKILRLRLRRGLVLVRQLGEPSVRDLQCLCEIYTEPKIGHNTLD